MSSDCVTPETRSRMMAGIRGKNTKPEQLIRSELHRRGFRFRLHRKNLLGKPDLVFPKYRAIIFVHGCFWHGHDCHLFKWPMTRQDFWCQKIQTNMTRDGKQITLLLDAKWRVAVVWECALKGRTRLSTQTVAERCARWLKSKEPMMKVRGNETRTVA